MNKTRLIINFSPEAEVNRVKRTLNDLAWLNENGYNVKLPIKLADTIKNGRVFSEQEITDSVTDEFNNSEYEEKEVELLSQWAEKGKDFVYKLASLGLPLSASYMIILTKYGTGGSYNLPNIVVLKLSTTKPIIDILFHEIIHLTIELLIKQYKIDHWTKERLVDLVFGKIFPDRLKLQKNPEKSDEVSIIFDSLFPDIEKIIIEISRL